MPKSAQIVPGDESEIYITDDEAEADAKPNLQARSMSRVSFAPNCDKN